MRMRPGQPWNAEYFRKYLKAPSIHCFSYSFSFPGDIFLKLLRNFLLSDSDSTHIQAHIHTVGIPAFLLEKDFKIFRIMRGGGVGWKDKRSCCHSQRKEEMGVVKSQRRGRQKSSLSVCPSTPGILCLWHVLIPRPHPILLKWCGLTSYGVVWRTGCWNVAFLYCMLLFLFFFLTIYLLA